MNLLEPPPSAPAAAGVMTIGVFDALHLGHRSLFETMCERARCLPADRIVTVVTFSAHPKEVLQGIAPTRLLHQDLKYRTLRLWGVDQVVELETNRNLLSLQADEFAERLFARLAPRVVVLGSEFRFGKDRKGSSATFESMGRAEVERIPTLMEGELAVSATLARRFLASGQIERAADILGRPYAVLGAQEAGDRIGRGLGSPTMNLIPPPEALPDGVYAVGIGPFLADFRGAANFLPAVAHIGPRPTFESYERRFEVHVLDRVFDDVADRWEVRFHSKLRDVVMFTSADELRKQISRDIAGARAVLAEAGA